MITREPTEEMIARWKRFGGRTKTGFPPIERPARRCWNTCKNTIRSPR